MTGEIRRRFRLLEPGARARWAVLAPLGLLDAALEALGGALVFALVSVLLAPPDLDQGRLTATLRAWFPGESRATLLSLATLAAAVHVARNLLVVAIAWWRARVTAFDTAALSARLLRAYLGAPWPFHLRRNSAVQIETIRESTRPFFEVFESASMVLTEGAVVVALAIVAASAAPVAVTLISLLIAVVLAAVLQVTRAAQRRGGEQQFELATALYRHVQHALGALKEVRILGRAGFFSDAFTRDARACAALDTRRATLDAVPRLVLETSFIVGLLVLVATGAAGADPATVLPLVSLYAYTGFRIIPAAHRIALHVNNLRWGLAATAPLVKDLQTFEPPPGDAPIPVRMEFRQSLQAELVQFAYGDGGRPVLEGLSLTIRCGESVAIVGATGAGKSTLVDLLIGLLTPSSGRVTVDGVPIDTNLAGWQRNIGYVPQTPFLLDDTLRRNVAFGVPDAGIDDAALGRALTTARLDDVVSRMPHGLDTMIGERGIRLSGGERQRISIARALYGNPSLVIFDEATSSLDPGTEREVAQAIDALRGPRTIIVIAHRLTTVARCERVLLIAEGRLAADGPYGEIAAGNAAFRSVAAL